MHKEILVDKQAELLNLLKTFSSQFKLVGGTAIALQIGHRESIDFDLFSDKEFENHKIKQKIPKNYKIDRIIRDEKNQLTFYLNDVFFTFFYYPFDIDYKVDLDNIIKMPDLLSLAAMKAYALARRAKWKDYVDLYFIMRDFHTIQEIIEKTKKIFVGEFNEKMFKAQLAYFEDINYSEKIVYRKGFEVPDEQIKKALVEYSLI